MQSIETVPSPDDPSPKIAELVDTALRLSFTTPNLDTDSPETEPLTLHSYDGAAVLQKLLPHLPIETVWALRDRIAEQGVYNAPEIETIDVVPASLLSGWLKRLRFGLRGERQRASLTLDTPTPAIEILQPVVGYTKQLHAKTDASQRAIVVRRSVFNGSGTIDGEPFEFNANDVVLEVGSISLGDAPYTRRNYFAHPDSTHITFVPHTGEVYRSEYYGGSMDDCPLQDPRARKDALDEMRALLTEVQAASNITPW